MHPRLPLITTAVALAVAASAAGTISAPTSRPAKPVRFLALGDSYTVGESVEANARWPMQLSEHLNRQGYQVDVQVIARTGWTTDELWAGIQETETSPPYDLVSLLIGVNNQYRGRSLDEYREQFRFLLGKAIGYAGGQPGHVLVLSIPDWGLTPFGHGREPAQIAREIDAFNQVNRVEAVQAGAHYVDITPESRADARDPGFIAPDDLHPSGKMYAAWAELALPAALQALSR
jgi:lysophospholipase L1-like esterase